MDDLIVVDKNVKIKTKYKLENKMFLTFLLDKVDEIESISTIYQKIDTQYRYKISVIVSKEEHFEDV